MVEDSHKEITKLLRRLDGSDLNAVDELFPLVYGDLKRMAGGKLKSERMDHTLNATALVHECYINLAGKEDIAWQNRAHFFAMSAQAMRRILINYANARSAQKRGGGKPVVTLNDEIMGGGQRLEDLLDLDHAMSKLATRSGRQAKLVELRFYGGLTNEEIGEVLGLSVPTIVREWRIARAFLKRELGR